MSDLQARRIRSLDQALVKAAKGHHLDIVQWMCECKELQSLLSFDGRKTALNRASASAENMGSVSVIDYLLTRDRVVGIGDLDEETLCNCASLGERSVFEYLIHRGDWKAAASDVLEYAAAGEQDQLIEYLYPFVQSDTTRVEAALCAAMTEGHVSTAETLLRLGARLGSSSNGMTRRTEDSISHVRTVEDEVMIRLLQRYHLWPAADKGDGNTLPSK